MLIWKELADLQEKLESRDSEYVRLCMIEKLKASKLLRIEGASIQLKEPEESLKREPPRKGVYSGIPTLDFE